MRSRKKYKREAEEREKTGMTKAEAEEKDLGAWPIIIGITSIGASGYRPMK